jgi:hypothetical protein
VSESDCSSTCEEQESSVLSSLDQNQSAPELKTSPKSEQKVSDYKPTQLGAKSDLITLSGSQLKNLIKEYAKACVREELGEILETLLAQKKVQSV